MAFLEVQQNMTEHLTVCKSRKSCIKEKRKHLSHNLDCSSPNVAANILITILLSVMTIMIKVIPTLYLMLSFFLFFKGSLGSMTDFVIRRAGGTRRGKVSNPTMRAKIIWLK